MNVEYNTQITIHNFTQNIKFEIQWNLYNRTCIKWKTSFIRLSPVLRIL